MKVGIIGSGVVGLALGRGFAAKGDEVMIGSRTPDKEEINTWLNDVGAKASSGTFEEAAKFGELVVLATKWEGIENALKMAGAENLAGKVVLDATNPLRTDAPGLAIGFSDSSGETVQRLLPESKVVKIFNHVGNTSMVKPNFAEGTPTLFICGNDAEAKTIASNVAKDFGWADLVDIGDITGARLLEPLAMLWIVVGFTSGSWTHTFKLLKK